MDGTYEDFAEYVDAVDHVGIAHYDAVFIDGRCVSVLSVARHVASSKDSDMWSLLILCSCTLAHTFLPSRRARTACAKKALGYIGNDSLVMLHDWQRYATKPLHLATVCVACAKRHCDLWLSSNTDLYAPWCGVSAR
jgi:hypothetical protein